MRTANYIRTAFPAPRLDGQPGLTSTFARGSEGVTRIELDGSLATVYADGGRALTVSCGWIAGLTVAPEAAPPKPAPKGPAKCR